MKMHDIFCFFKDTCTVLEQNVNNIKYQQGCFFKDL